jgi:hypothetical protein
MPRRRQSGSSRRRRARRPSPHRAAHALLHARARDQRGAAKRQPEHLEVRHAESAPEVGGRRGQLARPRGVAAGVRDVALVEREPAVLGRRVERVEQAMGTPQPPVRHRRGAAEVELVGRQPGSHAGGGGGLAAGGVEVEGPLAGGEHGVGVVEPPRRPAQPLLRRRGLPGGEEGGARLVPARGPEQRPAVHATIIRRRTRSPGPRARACRARWRSR